MCLAFVAVCPPPVFKPSPCVAAGLRDWYLRNTVGANHQSQVNGKVNSKVKCQAGGGALQIRRKTIGVIQPPTYQMDANHHHPPPHCKQALPHSATFHGHPLHARCEIRGPLQF